VREWIYKSDEAGKPRRFLNHREAILWAMITVGKVFGALALYWLINFIFVAFTDGELGGAMLTFMLTAILLVAWLLISLILYLYVALSGGVWTTRPEDATATTRRSQGPAKVTRTCSRRLSGGSCRWRS